MVKTGPKVSLTYNQKCLFLALHLFHAVLSLEPEVMQWLQFETFQL